jgi:hypothetical protein
MKMLRLGLAVWLLSRLALSAQVKIEVVPEQDQFLPGETLTVAARVSNLSGQSLELGGEPDWLTFSVESRDGLVVAELAKAPVQGEFTLDSSKVAIKRVDLAPCFNLTRPGRYTVTAAVRIRAWNQEFSSKPRSFDIIQGAKLWEQEFGLPQPGNQSPEVRKYVLQQANYLRQLKLYIRITDLADTRVFRVFAIGPMISFSQPQPQVDKSSNLHVLWQTGARAFAYRVINPDGDVIVRQTYDLIGSRPRLQFGEEGKVIVHGGARRVTRDDLPAPETAATNVPAATR